jgi:hypothetical protein
MTSTFAQTGGAQINMASRYSPFGFVNLSWPFGRLSADRDAITLDCLFKFTIPRDYIARLSRDPYHGFFSTGLQIEHTVPNFPDFMLFRTFNFDSLKRGLEGLGYAVRD